jgi:hypothetical protein
MLDGLEACVMTPGIGAPSGGFTFPDAPFMLVTRVAASNEGAGLRRRA